MRLGLYLSAVIFLLFSLGYATESNDAQRVFDRVWTYSKSNIYPAHLQAKFTKFEYNKIHKHLSHPSTDLQDVANSFNKFLNTLNVSHTHFYEKSQQGYYFLRSLFSTRNIDLPKAVLIGIQTEQVGDKHIIRAVLNDSPASKAGLKRGDVLLEVNGKKYKSFLSFSEFAGKNTSLKIRSGKKERILSIVPKKMSIHREFLRATENSGRLIQIGQSTIGYIRLWCGTNNKFLEVLRDAVFNQFSSVDGFILDLRDGYGGAWWDYLDPFFPNRKDYFVAKKVDRSGNEIVLEPAQKTNEIHFDKPMVVLINEGVRSGKESLAYQFKKTRRATLVGTTTAGAFVGGQGGFSSEDNGYIMYLSIFELFLDGNKIEGIGVSPDIEVAFPLNGSFSNDPQFEMAKEVLEAKIN